jgi:hypothetical protein
VNLRTLLPAAVLLLAAAGCEPLTPPPDPSGAPAPVGVPIPAPDHRPPPGDAPHGPGPDAADLWVHAFAGTGGREIAEWFALTVTAWQFDGSQPIWVDEETGLTMRGPRVLPPRETPYRFRNTMGAEVQFTEFVVAADWIPPGAVLTCLVMRPDTGKIVDQNEAVQTAPGGGALSVTCTHLRLP